MQVCDFIDYLKKFNAGDFFVGVPDSQLKPLCNYLMKNCVTNKNHIIAANEGNCVAIAAGYHMSTGNVPVVYLQNSGIGNIINPVVSLLNNKVYAIPCIFIVGWRGEPGVKDEPQHVYQGEITLKLLEDIGIQTIVLDSRTDHGALTDAQDTLMRNLNKGNSVAFVIKKGALHYDGSVEYKNNNDTLREDVIRQIVKFAGEDIIVSTTGKTSRELFEIRERNGQTHKYDFLTVGSMGHSSSIAMAIAMNKPNARVWCIDGDGAALMHMGAMAVIGASKPENLIHVVLNNNAHESVGGMPTVSNAINFPQIASACGYEVSECVDSLGGLDSTLERIKTLKGPIFLEVKTAIGSRDDLGRPTTTAQENKKAFMNYLGEI